MCADPDAAACAGKYSEAGATECIDCAPGTSGRYQVGHDDGASEAGGRSRYHVVENVAVPYVKVPVVGACERELVCHGVCPKYLWRGELVPGSLGAEKIW